MPEETEPDRLGAGAMTGRGLGGCASASANGQFPGYGAGCQRRAGRGEHARPCFGRGFTGAYPAVTQKEALEQQRVALQADLIKSMAN